MENKKSFRDLQNYKNMHRETAKKRGVETEFLAAKTLTQARALAFGKKVKSYEKYKGWSSWK